jgi:hypothetical protein
MKRATLVGILLLIWVAQPLHAQRAYRCLLKDPKDPDTCVPPPCEFMAGLELAKASLRAYAKFPAPPPGASGSVRLKRLESIAAEIEKGRTAYRRCGPALVPVFTLSPAPSCEITESLDAAIRSTGTCRELIEASYKQAETRQELCRVDNPALRSAVAGKHMMIGGEDEIKDLKASLLGYLASCVPDAELSRQLTDAGLDALNKVGRILRDNWLASRASAPAAGGR